MSARPLGVGVIGANPDRGWGSRAHLPALALVDEVEAVAVSTTRRETAEESARRFGVPAAYDDVAELLADDAVDVVAVCVKVCDHDPIVRAAIAAGKHVYCEWPLGADLGEARSAADAASAAGVSCLVGLQGRDSPAVRRLAALVADGYVGRVHSATLTGRVTVLGGAEVAAERAFAADYAKGLSVLSVPAAHALDALLLAVGEPVDVAGLVGTMNRRVRVAETGEELEATAPDQVAATLRLESGAIATVHVQGGLPGCPELVLTVLGSEGRIELRCDGGSVQYERLTLLGARGDASLAALDVPVEDGLPPDGPAANVARVYRRLAAAVAEGRSAESDFAEAVRRHELIDAIVRSSEQGRRLELR